MKTIKRTYACPHCEAIFYVYQPADDEKIKHCPCCESKGLDCNEEGIKEC